LQQEAHHKRRSFREELVMMLRKHHIEFEDWMLDDDAKIGG
jgi:hypothetical protein